MRVLDRLVDFLAVLGFLVIVGARAWQQYGKVLPGRFEYYLGAGLFLVVLQVLLRWDRIVARLGRRQMKYGGNMTVLILGVLGVLGLLNHLAARRSVRWDLTKGQRYSLSDQSRKVLASLKEDVRIVYFQRSLEMGAGRDRLSQYETASPRVKVEYVDPVQNPARAQAYDVRGPWPIIVVEKGDRRERVTNDTEQDLTNAFLKVTREGRKTVCFVYGQGERDIEDGSDRGYSSAKAVLAKNQYETKKVLLAREADVPADCTVVVVPGPEKDLLPASLEALRRYVKGAGKVMVMLEPPVQGDVDGVVGLLKEWNLEAGRDVVVDVSPMGQLFGTGPFTPVVAQYPYHEITKDFRVMTAFHVTRSLQVGTGTLEGVTPQALLETSEASWAETDLTLKDAKMDEGKDRQGPIALGAVATVAAPSAAPGPSPAPSPSPAEEAAPRREGRVAAFGDSDFASNALLGFQGNQDFFLNTVAWLAEDADLISIRPREPEDQRLFLTRGQQQNVALLALVLLPGLFVALGAWSWWKRR
ncbi:MAG TPA: GldG family protein [Vicinamibacteria bacterium]|jgi:ABC-type uncharacterized transport system involved in gliding motility auxiliary subunit